MGSRHAPLSLKTKRVAAGKGTMAEGRRGDRRLSHMSHKGRYQATGECGAKTIRAPHWNEEGVFADVRNHAGAHFPFPSWIVALIVTAADGTKIAKIS